MRKKLVVIFSVLMLGVNPALAFAQTTATATPTPATTRQTVRDAMKDAREDFKDQMSQAREDFKTKLEALKDQRKQAAVNQFDAKINDINKRRTDQMSGHLERLQRVLNNVSSKAAALKSQGQNTATVDASVVAAQKAIDDAKQAVVDQAAKDYVMAIISAATLRNTASTTMQQFISDIRDVLQEVLAARTAVRKAHTDLAKIMGGKTTPTVAPTATPTP